MIGRLLLIAALVGAVVGVAPIVLGGACGCGTGGTGIQTYDLTTAAYCPTSTYPNGCNITLLRETNCKITCDGARSTLVYRNNSAIWLTTKSISCTGGVLTNEAGATLYNLMRPTCAMKNTCDGCGTAWTDTVETGMTSNSDNLIQYTEEDGCSRLTCASGAKLQLYDVNNKLMNYQASQLYCTVANKWTNYSLDGTTTGGNTIIEPISASCQLPKACELCTAPTIATALTQLPTTFRTGYLITQASYTVQPKSCSVVLCPAGYVLYGFNGTAATSVTGLEYTSRGSLLCDGNSKWTNGGYSPVPTTLISACLKVAPPTTTPTPTTQTTTPPTTPAPGCAGDDHDTLTLDAGVAMSCLDGQSRVKCATANKKIEVFTASETFLFEGMSWVSGKGWLSFDCTGNAKMWKTGLNEIMAVACEGAV